MSAPRITITGATTQALSSLVATVGSHSLDLRQGPAGSLVVTVWNPAFSDAVIYQIEPDGYTREIREIPA